MIVTTASAARPSLARRASDPVDHGSTTAITPSIAAIRSSPAPIAAATAGSSTSMSVGDDGDLASGFGELVESLGDATGFGAGSGAEAR